MENKFKFIRFVHGKTQQELSKELGISQSHLSQIEQGKINPSRRVLNRYCIVFGLDEDYFLN